MIKLRVDVDYPYVSRVKSVCYMMYGFPRDKDYLKNAHIIAEKINASGEDVKAFWFFTTRTLPNDSLLRLLDSPKHEIGLHIVNDAYGELEVLQTSVPSKICYYSIHGTESVMGQLLWERRIGQKQAVVPEGFPLKSFHDFPTCALDALCRSCSVEEASKQGAKWSNEKVLLIHPEWLFNHNKNRGPFNTVLEKLLNVNT